MSLSDPISLSRVSAATAAANESYAFPTDYVRLNDGRFLNSTSNIGAPMYFNIDSSINPDGVSSYVFKITWARNVEGEPDAVMQAHTVIKWPHDSFTEAEAVEITRILCGALLKGDTLTRVFRGER